MEYRYKLSLLTPFLIFLFIPFNLFAQFNFDTLETNIVGPGVVHYKINETTQPWAINLLEVDLKNPFIKIETVKSFDRSAEGRERTTSMAARKSSPGHLVVGAVNGDFFNLTTGGVNNIQVVNGEVVRRERPDYPSVGFNSLNNVFIGKPSYSGKLLFKNSSVNITAINEARSDDALISYNSFNGSTTGTNDAGTEILLTPINFWVTNDTIYAIVDSLAVSDGSMNLSPGKMVLSANGSFEQALAGNISKGDTVKILINFLPGLPQMDQVIGGHPLMVTNGAVANMDPNDGLVFNRHPRTAVGVNQDTSKLYIVVVDGRQLISAGMTLFELADYMMSLGAHSAMNLDGGGSSTFVVRDVIENSPSDGTERTVANALMVVSTAPVGDINQIKISPSLVRMFIGGIQQFTLSGYDEYFNPVILSPSMIQYSLSKPSLGFINNNGLFSASSTADSGYVIVHYGSLKDSVQLTVKGVDRLEISPATAVTDNSQIINFSAKVFDTDNIEQPVSAPLIQWSVTDTTVGSIDPAGQFSGKSEGVTTVIASFMGKNDSAIVFVEIGMGIVVLDSMESIQQWSLSGLNIDTSATTLTYSTEQESAGEGSFRLDYSFKYETGNFNWAYLNCNLDIFGIPDSMLVDVFSDGFNHRLFFDFEDASGNVPRINTNKIANKPGVFETIKGKLPSVSSSIVYPLKLKRIAIALGSTSVAEQQYSGTIFFDNLRLRYKTDVTSIDEEEIIPSEFMLYQNYPNPFNPNTSIQYAVGSRQYTIPSSPLYERGDRGEFVTLKVFDVLGNEIATLVDEEKNPGIHEVEWNASGLSSGIYFYTLISGRFIQTKKLILLK